MTHKPTYEELEQRVKELEIESVKRRQAEEALVSERNKLKSLLDGLTHTNIGVDIVSTDYEVLLQNQTLIDRFGDSVGKKCFKKYMALDEPCAFCPMVKATENNRLERIELRAADGRDYELLTAPLANPDGTIDKAIEVVQDITDRKRAEEALRKSEEQLRLIAESSAEIIYQLNLSGNIIYISPALEKVFGYTPEEVLNLGYTPFFPESEYERVEEAINKALGGENFQLLEFMSKRKDGSFFPIEISLTPTVKDGGIIGIQGVTRDITERKQAEKEREKLINELQNALKEIKTLRGILPICSSCKKIRDDKGYWQRLEAYIHEHAEVEFSHGFCPDCMKKLYPDYAGMKDKNG